MVFNAITIALIVLSGIALMAIVAAFTTLFWRNRPDAPAAHLSEELLRLANLTLDYVKQGLSPQAARSICEMLLPATQAIAVGITNKTTILAYLGYYGDEKDPTGGPIRTEATKETIADGRLRVIRSQDDIGFPVSITKIEAAIIVPLKVGSSEQTASTEGVLKLYYQKANRINGTQISVAQGIGRLLSTQMTAVEMENQRGIATNMELKVLQSQINPHFLFNTINTIASLVRTDPIKARTLLRDFAAFYRSTLENPSESILLTKEISQTLRYFSLVIARFGEDRVAIDVQVDEELDNLLVPPFLIQPIVENSVTHGMASEDKLIVSLVATAEGDDATIKICDNGVGMDVERFLQVSKTPTSTGHGLALRNVEDRVVGAFGPGSGMLIESELGVGTCVTLTLKNALNHQGNVG